MPPRTPDATPRPPRRLSGALAAGTATANTVAISEIVPVFGSARVKVRAKVATAGATLDLTFMGPDTAAESSTSGTAYTTGNPTQVALAANTEGQIFADCYGEGFVKVTITGTGTGSISYVDLSQV